jgi:MFS family permease
LKCESEIVVGLFGSFFLAGIVLGSVTVTRIGDVYGRREGFMFGLII